LLDRLLVAASSGEGLLTERRTAAEPWRHELAFTVESRCGAVAVGGTYLLPPRCLTGSTVAPFPHTGRQSPASASTERSVQISCTTLFGVDSRHCESLQRPVGQPQSWSEQRDPRLEPIEGGPGKVTACPAAATEHLAPVTLSKPVHPLQCSDISCNAVSRAHGELRSASTCSWIGRCLICRI